MGKVASVPEMGCVFSYFCLPTALGYIFTILNRSHASGSGETFAGWASGCFCDYYDDVVVSGPWAA